MVSITQQPPGRFRRFLFGAAGGLVSLMLLPALVRGVEAPRYEFQVRVDGATRTISANLTLSVAENDPRPPDEWLLHLPPNRFLKKDQRGPRRNVGPLPFGFFFADPDYADPMFPNGPDLGGMEIKAVTDGTGRPVLYTLESNPKIPKGYHSGRGMLRVRFPRDGVRRTLTISFVTRLPNRHWDGWDETGVLAENWYPVLLPFLGGGWITDPSHPAPGIFSGTATLTRAAWVVVGKKPPQRIPAGQEMQISAPSAPSAPARTLPLIALWGEKKPFQDPAWPGLRVFYRSGDSRVAKMGAEWGGRFLLFAQRFYGLPAPPGGLTLVESSKQTGRIWTVGTTIFIPTAYFRNPALLDRLFYARLGQAIAEIWFGETLWANRDSQAWLHLGLTGFLALDFFEFAFGWDGSIHDLVDWLSPKYREHFLEDFALGMVRKGRDTPLVSSLYSHPQAGEVLGTLFHKAPLVFRALKYATGRQVFQVGLAGFFRNNLYRTVDGSDLEREMLAACGTPPAPPGEPGDGTAVTTPPRQSCAADQQRVFQQWFYGRARLDYQLAGWKETPTPAGNHVTVTVRRLEAGSMPLDVQVTASDGQSQLKRITGLPAEETVSFDLQAPVSHVALDPREYLLEIDRQNNHSSRTVRLRPIYDWAKQKETLVTVVGTLGGNPIDGNYAGLGAGIYFNERSRLNLVPIYSERQSELNFEGLYQYNRFLHPDLQFLSRVRKLGGSRQLSLGGILTRTLSDTRDFATSFSLQWEEVDAAAREGEVIQENGNTNNIAADYTARFSLGSPFSTVLFAELENSQEALGSDFAYTRAKSSFRHTFALNSNHTFRMDLVRGWTFGTAPVQKQHPLGDPTLLRGYPRHLDLVYDNVAGFRSEYRYVVSRKIFGQTFQTRKIELILSYDIGKGWDEGEAFETAPTRKNAGVGFNIDFNSLEMLTFPLRVEIAAPVGDSEYGDSQFIFFQVLSFF